MSEKQFFLQIKKQLPPKTFIQKIENKFNSGFPDLIIINEMLPLFIELKAPTKGNKFKVELSQISTHLRIKANNYVSFFLVRHPLTKALYLFEGGSVCEFLAFRHSCDPLRFDRSRRFLDPWIVGRSPGTCESKSGISVAKKMKWSLCDSLRLLATNCFASRCVSFEGTILATEMK